MFKKFSFLTLGRTSGDISYFLLFILIARTFGQESIGHYSFAMALAGFFVVFADFGLYYLTIKELSHTNDSFEVSFSSIWSLRILLSVCVLASLVLLTHFLPLPTPAKPLIVLIGISVILGAVVDGFSAVFIAHGDMKRAGLLNFFHRVTGTTAAILVLLSGGTLYTAVSMLPIMTVLHCGGAYYLSTRSFGPHKLARSWSSVFNKLRVAIPYGFSELLGQMAIRTNIVLLGFLLGTTEAGTYNVAYRIVLGLLSIQVIVGITLLPTASSLHQQDKNQLVGLYHNSLSLMVVLGLPTSCGIWLIAPDLIHLLFGQGYSQSIPLLRILAVLIFLFSLRNVLGTFLTAVNLQSERTRREWYGAIALVGGNLLLIPILGVMGSVIATIASEVFLLVLFVVPLHSILGWPQIGQAMGRSGVACTIFLLTFSFFSSSLLIAKILGSVILYFVTLFLFKDVRQNEFPKFLNLFQNRRRKIIPSTEETY